jgi:membrane-bound ClpP family serine protease
MKLYLFPILLQLLGTLVIIAEIFIPSLGLLTLIALGLFSYSLFLVYTTISTNVGMVFTGLDMVMIPGLVYMGIKLLARSSLSLKQELSQKQGVASQAKKMETYINMEGKAVTDLRPAGMAQIKSERLDVVTDGEYIDAGTPVVVTQVTGNQIIVGQIKK